MPTLALAFPWHFAATLAVAVVLGTLWDRRHPVDEEHDAREAAFTAKWALVLLIGVALLTLALALAEFSVPGAAWAAFGGVFVVLAIWQIGPFFGPRRRR